MARILVCMMLYRVGVLGEFGRGLLPTSQNPEARNCVFDWKCSKTSPEAVKPVVVKFDPSCFEPQLPEIMGYLASTSQQEAGSKAPSAIHPKVCKLGLVRFELIP